MKELVLDVKELSHDGIRQKVMKTVSKISGVESVSVHTANRKLTLKGNIDPVKIVGKLRKVCCAEIISVGPAKKKEEPKKDADKKADEKPKDQSKESCTCQHYPVHMGTPYYYYCTVEEYPNSGCVIC